MLAILLSSCWLILTSATSSASLTGAFSLFSHQNSPSSCRLTRAAQQQQLVKTRKASDTLNSIPLVQLSGQQSLVEWRGWFGCSRRLYLIERKGGQVCSAIIGSVGFLSFPPSLLGDLKGFSRSLGHDVLLCCRQEFLWIAWLDVTSFLGEIPKDRSVNLALTWLSLVIRDVCHSSRVAIWLANSFK